MLNVMANILMTINSQLNYFKNLGFNVALSLITLNLRGRNFNRHDLTIESANIAADMGVEIARIESIRRHVCRER